MRFVYVMDALDRVAPDKDTTFAFVRAAQRRGHTALHCLPRDLFVKNGAPYAAVRPLRVRETAPHCELGEPEDVSLATVDAVFIRKDPPFDLTYYYATLLLERARNRTIILNDPRGIRDANEKLYALHFSRHMPRSIVASNPAKLVAFIEEIGGTGVIKPLHGAGGAGVMLVATNDRNMRSILEMHTQDGQVEAMVQEYVPDVVKGDKRVLLLDGNILGAINRVPRKDDLRSNIHVGGRVERCDVTPHEKTIVADMAPRLRADGLVFVGLDFIGNRLTEVNVTSPTGIQELSQHMGRDVAVDVIEWVERAVGDMAPTLRSIPPA